MRSRAALRCYPVRHGQARCGRETARKFEFSLFHQAVQFELSQSLAAPWKEREFPPFFRAMPDPSRGPEHDAATIQKRTCAHPRFEEAKRQASASSQVDLVEGSKWTRGRVPVVFVSAEPPELVQTDGPPQYSPIARTQLLYVTNSPNRVFLDLQTQQYYLLLSGRWYRAGSLSQSA